MKKDWFRRRPRICAGRVSGSREQGGGREGPYGDGYFVEHDDAFADVGECDVLRRRDDHCACGGVVRD